MAYDPFADDTKATPRVASGQTTTAEGPKMEQGGKDNWVSLSFNSATGYDRIGATVHGTPQFVAEAFGIENFDGRISTLMKRAILVDSVFKKWYAGDSGKD